MKKRTEGAASEDKALSLDDMVLKPTENNARKITLARIAAITTMLFSILIIVTEATVVFHPTYTLFHFVRYLMLNHMQIIVKHPSYVLVNIIFTYMFLASLTLVCFFTIFNLKLSDYLQLVPHHTDCVTFSSITGFCTKIIVKTW